jgi:hypothetical protein
MLDNKMMMAGFLKYLQDYYGMTYDTVNKATGLSNVMRVPLFQKKADNIAEFEAMMALEQQQMGPMGMDMGDEFSLPMDQGLAPESLNAMFPGPYDAVGMQ